MKGNALGDHSTVTYIEQQHVQHCAPEPLSWPVLVGAVPQLASAFQPRTELRARVDAARQAGGAVVLTQVLSGGGGVGKTQLAAAYASEALQGGTELVVWLPAGEEQQVVAVFAQAAARVRAPGATGEDPVTDAKAFLAWLATTKRRWLVVLDDIADPQAVHAWWPTSHTSAGWILATTRLHDARLTGGGRRRVDVDVYTPDEAHTYLRNRLNGDGAERLLDDQSQALAEALGHLPLALGHAAAYMISQGETCTRYLERFKDRDHTLDQILPSDADTEGYGRAITTTLLLALEAADRTEPIGLATPILRLSALLDPAGHPAELWTTTAALTHLTKHRPERGERTTADQAHKALRTLNRYALLSLDAKAGPRAVRIHALTARATRETTPEPLLPELSIGLADALEEAWPDPDLTRPSLAAALRANADSLHRYGGEHLWHPHRHRVIFRAGNSLLHARLSGAAIGYWQRMANQAHRLLGPEHPDTLTARSNLAASYEYAGRISEAIALEERVLGERERLLGPDHPDTLTARGNLAGSYRQVGRISEAIALEERVLGERERLLGPNHSRTLTARGNLAASYLQAGRIGKAIELQERVLADHERLLGSDRPNTLTSRSNLAVSYEKAGRTAEAIDLQQRALADRERLLGPDHPDSLTARNNLAGFIQQAGRTSEAIDLKERVVADHERLLGPDHPDTLTARNNLAYSYGEAGRADEAIDLKEQVLTDRERVLGPEHPGTLIARNNLAASYLQAGRISEAIGLQKRVLADWERLLGSDHPNTVLARHNLAASYQQAGGTNDANEP